MREIASFEAKTKLGQVLDWVESGEEVIITRRGKPVARVISPDASTDRERANAAVARIRARRRGVTLGDLSIKDLIDAARL